MQMPSIEKSMTYLRSATQNTLNTTKKFAINFLMACLEFDGPIRFPVFPIWRTLYHGNMTVNGNPKQLGTQISKFFKLPRILPLGVFGVADHEYDIILFF